MKAVSLAASALVLAVLGFAGGALADSAGPYPGTYAGGGEGVKATVVVNDRGRGSLRYALRGQCGRARGRIDLGAVHNGAYSAGRVSTAPHKLVRRIQARIEPVGDGTVVRGTIRETVSRKSGGPCRVKRSFEGELGNTEAFVPGRDDGHYRGQSEDGLAISFDVVSDGRGTRMTAIGVDVAGECTDVAAGDHAGEIRIVHLRGLEGPVSSNGEIDIELDDGANEFDLFGKLGGGAAKVEVWIDGLFNLDGLPDQLASLACDNDEPIYTATRG
jgi:hypothetical protein